MSRIVDLSKDTEFEDCDVSAAQLAKIFKVAEITIYKWSSDYGMPKKDRGFSLVDCLRWRLLNLEQQIENLQKSFDSNLRDRKAHEIELDIKRKEVALKKDLAELLNKKDVIITLTNLLNVIKQSYRSAKHDLIRELELDSHEIAALEKIYEATEDTIARLDIEDLIRDEESMMDL